MPKSIIRQSFIVIADYVVVLRHLVGPPREYGDVTSLLVTFRLDHRSAALDTSWPESEHWPAFFGTARYPASLRLLDMLHHMIRITAFDRPMPSVRRQVGTTNVGIYCRCGEFISFAVIRGEPAFEYAFTADQLIPIVCPFCGNQDLRHADEIVQQFLTEANVRRRG